MHLVVLERGALTGNVSDNQVLEMLKTTGVTHVRGVVQVNEHALPIGISHVLAEVDGSECTIFFRERTLELLVVAQQELTERVMRTFKNPKLQNN